MGEDSATTAVAVPSVEGVEEMETRRRRRSGRGGGVILISGYQEGKVGVKEMRSRRMECGVESLFTSACGLVVVSTVWIASLSIELIRP